MAGGYLGLYFLSSVDEISTELLQDSQSNSAELITQIIPFDSMCCFKWPPTAHASYCSSFIIFSLNRYDVLLLCDLCTH